MQKSFKKTLALILSIVMIIGVLPMIFAVGAGANSRISVGSTVFGGMVAACTLGAVLTPAFYVLVQEFVDKLQNEFKARTGINIECMVYGDGAFKDPVGGIWELADPVVSPAYTSGLKGTPNEIKLKYMADNKLADLTGEVAVDAMKTLIKEKNY